MGFHRLTTPSYTGGLPGGYDYINNAVSGTPADANGVLSGGTNVGSYFVGHGESAASGNVNRPALALAQNTDALDDLFHRDIAVTTKSGDTTVVGVPTTSVTLTGPGIFLGSSGTPATSVGINTVFEITDANDEDIVDASGNKCVVTSITGGTIGTGGFSTGNVVLTISPGIPVGKTFHIYYGVRSNLAALPVDAFTTIKIRGAMVVPAELEGTGGAGLIGTAALGTWADGGTNLAQNVQAQLAQFITDLTANASSAHSGAAKVATFGFTGTHFSTSTSSIQANLNQLATAVDAIETTGTPAIQTFASTSALQASSATLYANACCFVFGKGVYGYDAASTLTEDGNFTVKPTSVGGGSPGRWRRMQTGLRGDSVFKEQFVGGYDTSFFNTLSGSYTIGLTAAGGTQKSFAGDVVNVMAIVRALVDPATGTEGEYIISVQEDAGAFTDISSSVRRSTATTAADLLTMVAQYTVVGNPSTLNVHVRVKRNAGTGNVYLLNPSQIMFTVSRG